MQAEHNMLFIYLDESGNYDFTKDGSEYLIYTALTTTNPYGVHHKLCELERDLKRRSIPLESGYFHATEDKQQVRNEVYDILYDKSLEYDIDSVIVEKCKTNPSIRDIHTLYKKVYGVLLQYVFRRYKEVNKIMIFADVIPDSKKKKDIEKGIKETLSNLLDTKTIKYHLLFISSLFSYGLQAVDYCCWAQKKKWGDWGEKIDLRAYDRVKHKMRSSLDLFGRGDGYKYY